MIPESGTDTMLSKVDLKAAYDEGLFTAEEFAFYDAMFIPGVA